jgi:hypothetical protein
LISDYNNINLVDEYITLNGEEHTSHNLYVRPGTDFLIISYYADGTRVINISDPTNLQEIAYYDMSDIEGLYVSNWGTYAYLPSGYVISSDIEQGLFVFELGGVSIFHDNIEDIDIDIQGPYVEFEAEVESFDGDVTDVTLYYSLDNINWNSVGMLNSNNNLYNATMTFDQSGIIVYYYITASNTLGQSSQYPQIEEYISFNYGDLIDILVQDFENENNWYVESTASAGLWEVGIPNVSYEQGSIVQTNEDHTIDGEKCFITGNAVINENSPGQGDVDGGVTVFHTSFPGLLPKLLVYHLQ